MKRSLFFLIVFLIPIWAVAQYNQKISINLASGIFDTFGKKVGEYDPMQMPNYQLGFSANGGLQIRINDRLSISAEVGFMNSRRWYYSEGDNNNYLYWYITLDTITYEPIAEGENYLDIQNYSFGVKPKYYLGPGKRWNPYFYAGVNINWTRAYFEDNLWVALDKFNMLDPDDTGPYNYNLETNFGVGFNPGFGVEFFPNERIGFNLSSGYYFIMLNKKNFKSPEREENFNAFVLQAGLRFYFIKSKDL